MTIDWDTLLNEPLYNALAYSATLTPDGTAAGVTIDAIDETAGIVLAEQGIDLQTIEPAAKVRLSDLDAAGIALEDLDDGTLVLNGTTWRIKSHRKLPDPDGSGEVLLLLAKIF
jgi:hypothetical protein